MIDFQTHPKVVVESILIRPSPMHGPLTPLPHSSSINFSEALTLGSATGGAGVAAHGDGHGLLGDVVEEGQSLLQLHAVDGLSGLTGVLEADTQVRAPRASALCGRNLLRGVTDLRARESCQQSWSLSWMVIGRSDGNR